MIRGDTRKGTAALLFAVALVGAAQLVDGSGSTLLRGALASAPSEGTGGIEVVTSAEGVAAKLLAIRSELAVARELARRGAVARAAPHLLAPLEELWEPIHGTLETRDEAVETRLEETLAEAAGAEGSAEMDQAATAAMTAIENALAALFPRTLRDSSGFRLALVRILLDDAVRAYASGVAMGRPVDPTAYERAYGLAGTAEELLRPLAESSSEREVAAAVRELMSELRTALPSLEPPAAPLPAGRFQALVSRIELRMGGLV